MSAPCIYCGNELSGHVCYSCVAELNQEIADQRALLRDLQSQMQELDKRLAAIEPAGVPALSRSPGTDSGESDSPSCGPSEQGGDGAALLCKTCESVTRDE